MAENRPKSASTSSAARTIFLRLMLVGISLGIAFFLCELVLRIIPIPGVEFNVSKYDNDVGAGLYPHATLIYRNDRGDTANRRVNAHGYLDVEHEKENKNGVTRIGFFGDSYTEARQVNLEETFFRRIEGSLGSDTVETFSFGISGFSTLQSYLTAAKWSDPFDIDLVVYVFVENDPGDNIPELKGHAQIPYPRLSGGRLSVDNEFQSAGARRAGLVHRIGDYLTSRSLVMSTISERLVLLKQHGVKVEVAEEDRWMGTKTDDTAEDNWRPTSDDLPSTWPGELRASARKLTEAVILEWSRESALQSRDFAVLYVPRAQEMEKSAEDQDSWKLWLQTFCREQGIEFVDPSAHLIAAQRNGTEVYYDHFTPEGHRIFSDSFVSWFETSYVEGAAVSE